MVQRIFDLSKHFISRWNTTEPPVGKAHSAGFDRGHS